MDKGELTGLIQYNSLVDALEKEFKCHVDLISKEVQIKNFSFQLKTMRFYYMNVKDKQNIETIIDYCNRIQEHVTYFESLNEDFFETPILQDARSLIIIQIGKHVNRLSDDFKLSHDTIPWKEIIAMRNVHTHHYEDVINEIVWETIQTDIPYLKQYLEQILYSNNKNQ